ncbi:MAG: uroporphyrinogen decarboxylase family protein, partial [Planctomycetota bacterium]
IADGKPVCLADDSICLISVEQYKEYVLPYHKRIIAELGRPEVTNYMHLCGDASRHFPTVRDELNVYSFDTGFPIDFAKVRRDLGEDVEIAGGVHVNLLLNGSSQEVYDEAKRILQSGIKKGGKFFLRDANNLAPRTPPENIKAMYQANLDFGKY